MNAATQGNQRGRPRIITREAIAAAGKKLTLPHATMADVAEELGVGIRSLYKHLDGVNELHTVTAEEIFATWVAPSPNGESLADHLLAVGVSLRQLAIENPGIAPFLVRASEAISPRVLRAMDSHQQSVASAYDLPLAAASMMLATVAEHTLSVTDTVHGNGGRIRDREKMARNVSLPAIAAAARKYPTASDEDFFLYGLRALIEGLVRITTRESD